MQNIQKFNGKSVGQLVIFTQVRTVFLPINMTNFLFTDLAIEQVV